MQEASDAATLVAKGCMGPIERQRLLRWDERLRITQSSLGTQAGLPSPLKPSRMTQLAGNLTCRAIISHRQVSEVLMPGMLM